MSTLLARYLLDESAAVKEGGSAGVRATLDATVHAGDVMHFVAASVGTWANGTTGLNDGISYGAFDITNDVTTTNNRPLSVSVTYNSGSNGRPGYQIRVYLATDGSGNSTSTITQVIAAINAYPAAASLVTASLGSGSGSDIHGSYGPSFPALSGGVDATPATMYDASGLGNHGTYKNASSVGGGQTSTTDRNSVADGALVMNVANTYPDPFDNVGLHGATVSPVAGSFAFAGRSTFTVKAWINVGTADSRQRGLFGSHEPSWPPGCYDSWGCLVSANSYLLSFFRMKCTTGWDQVSFDAAAYAGAWHEYTMVYDGYNIKLFVDDVLRGTTASTMNLSATAYGFQLGACPSNVIFGFRSYRYAPAGTKFDDVRVYAAALAPGSEAAIKNSFGRN